MPHFYYIIIHMRIYIDAKELDDKRKNIYRKQRFPMLSSRYRINVIPEFYLCEKSARN